MISAVSALRAIEAKVVEESAARDVALFAAAAAVRGADASRDAAERDALVARGEACAATASRRALTVAAEETRAAVEVELWAVAAALVDKQR